MHILYCLILAFFVLRHVTTAVHAVNAGTVYAHTFITLDGEPFSLDTYRGKVLLIVNTASRCGFTKQYAALQKIYDAYKDQGLVVIGMPSNDFGKQEPGTSQEIRQFCETHFHVTFPLTEKVNIIGKDAHPFFKQVSSEMGFWTRPYWNFFKYVVSRDGHLVEWFSSKTPPDADSVVKVIKAELAKNK